MDELQEAIDRAISGPPPDIHILHTPMTEVSRTDDGERWCFRCRARRRFLRVVETPIVVSWCDLATREVEFNTGAYYGPSMEVVCGTCGRVDGDCFPGTWREWGEW